RICAVRYLAGARSRAALDLIEQTRPSAVLEKGIRAASEQECALKRVNRAPDRLSRGKGDEIVALTRARPAVLVYALGRVVACDEDVGKGLVVTQQNVKPRAQPLDKISLK